MYVEWINSKPLLYRTGHYSQYPVVIRNGEEYQKRGIDVQLNHFAVLQKPTPRCKSTTLQ